MLKAQKYRLIPNNAQKVLLGKTFGCVRFAWNKNVDAFNSFNKETNPNPIFLTSTEVRNEFEWMKEVSAAAIQQKEIDFKEFKKQRFSNNRKKKIGNPSFKSKHDKQSFRLPNQKFSVEKNQIRLEKIGKVKFIIDRELPIGKLMSITISKDTIGNYYASILIETEIKQLEKTNKEVGIDVGIKEFLTSSDGQVVSNPKYFRESQSKLKKSQQRLSKKKKGSSRRIKAKLKVAKIHKKISNQREYFLHNVSTQLVKEYDTIVVEDLNVSGMIKNRKLSKSIADASWSKFYSMLDYKCTWYGKTLIKINRFEPTSKKCSSCGWIKNDLSLKDRIFNCEACNLSIDRDLNASINIKRVGVNALYNQSQSECKTGLPVIHVEAIKIS